MPCKQGDNAIIIRSLVDANIGRMVKVGQFVGDFHAMQEFDVGDGIVREAISDGVHWWIHAIGAPLESYSGRYTNLAIVADSWLQPIKGEPEKTKDTSKERDLVS